MPRRNPLLSGATVWALAAVLSTGALAQAPEPEADGVEVRGPDLPPLADGDFRVRVGERATVERLPRVNGRIVEMFARGIDPSVDLEGLFRGTTSAIEGLSAVPTAGGVWLLRAVVSPDDAGRPRDLKVGVSDGFLTLRVVDGAPPATRGRQAAPSLGELIRGEYPEVAPELPPASVFRVLPGDAIASRMPSWSYDFALTRAPASVLTATWDRVDAARRSMLRARPGSTVHQEYMYYLGYYYLEMGFGREARYYFSRISARPGNIPQRDIALERARAELACQNYEAARQWYEEAYLLGADPDSVLEGLAVLSLETGVPARAPTGRLLWASTSASGPLLLAAELLQIDGRVAESRDILEAIDPSALSRDQRKRWALRLGDARFYDRYEGNVEEAAAAWSQAEPSLDRVRDLYIDLHETNNDPKKWAELIPGLVLAATQRSDAGAEALYLLSQIDAAIGSREDAINDLAIILKRYPTKAAGSDVPERFWRVYSDYVSDLADVGRWFDIAALHESVWSSTVKRAVRDPQALIHVAEAYEAVGLPEQAESVLSRAAQVLRDQNADDPQLVFRLGEVFAQVGESAERIPESVFGPYGGQDSAVRGKWGTATDDVWRVGLETIDYLRAMDQDAVEDAKIDMLEARFRVGAADLDGAARALRRASTTPEYRNEASLQLALIDAESGRCDRAVPVLERLAVTQSAADLMAESRPWVVLARCELAAGDAPAAEAAARRAAGLAADRIAELDAIDAREALSTIPSVADATAEADTSDSASADGGGESKPSAADPTRVPISDRAQARTTTLRRELRAILEAEHQYAMGLAATAADWEEPDLVDALQTKGGIWSSMAEEHRSNTEFQAALKDRDTLPWNR